MQDQSSELSVSSPSFNSYSCDSLADIATKVCHELGTLDLKPSESTAGEAGAGDGDEEFEFVSLSAVAGEEVFLGGAARIGPVFPVFNRDLLSGSRGGDFGDRLGFRGGDGGDEEVSGPPSSSSSEADELDGIPEGTYCVWKPKTSPASPSPSASPEFRRKSKSTGSTSSKRWRFRDLLRRSNSDGKDSFVFLTPSLGGSKKIAGEDQKPEVRSPTAKIRPSGSDQTVRIGSAAGKGRSMAAAHEEFYVRNRAVNRTAEKRRSTFLPYRQDLVGFFANVNTMGRTFPPF